MPPGMMTRSMDIPLIITSAINVNAPRTKLGGISDRLHHTLEGLREWVTLRAFRRIIVCDGSGFDIAPYLKQLDESGDAGLTFESLCFQNDISLVAQRGKGYGEGQIVQHTLNHSRLLADADSFAKCTSKLWVTNAAECVRHYNGTAALNLSGGFSPKYVDTRFYIFSKAFYASHLSDCHRTVDEDHGYFLEHRFLESIKDTRMYRNTLYPTPTIRGVSGSMGTPYQTSRRNNLMKDFRNTVLCFAGY